MERIKEGLKAIAGFCLMSVYYSYKAFGVLFWFLLFVSMLACFIKAEWEAAFTLLAIIAVYTFIFREYLLELFFDVLTFFEKKR